MTYIFCSPFFYKIKSYRHIIIGCCQNYLEANYEIWNYKKADLHSSTVINENKEVNQQNSFVSFCWPWGWFFSSVLWLENYEQFNIYWINYEEIHCFSIWFNLRKLRRQRIRWNKFWYYDAWAASIFCLSTLGVAIDLMFIGKLMRLNNELVQTLLKSLLKDCCLFTETMLKKTKLFPGYPVTDISDKP